MEMTGPCSSVNFTSTMTAVGVRTDFRDDAIDTAELGGSGPRVTT